MVTEASNGIELSLVEPACGKRETLPDPSSVTSNTRLSTVPRASSSRACGWFGGEKYDNVAGSHGLFAQKSGAGPVDLDRSSRFELTASRDQCPISTPRGYDLHRARLARLLGLRGGGRFLPVSEPVPLRARVRGATWTKCCRNWRGCLRFEVCNVTEVFSPARSRGAKKSIKSRILEWASTHS